MSRFILSGFQSAVRSIISYSSRQVRSVMAAASSSSEADVRDNPDKEDADDLCRLSDSDEPDSDTELSNGNSLTVSGSKTSYDGTGVTLSPKRQFSVGSGSRTPVLEQEKDYSLCRILFAKEQPKRQFHFRLWNDSDKVYGTSQQVVSEERERYLSMSKEEKQKLYACGSKYVTLEDVETWQKHSAKRSVRCKYPSAGDVKQYCETAYETDDAINRKVSLWRGDITTLEIDAIVNAANSTLLGGGGVDGAIHRAAGSALVAECGTLHGCDTGDAKITGGYKLPAKYVVHTVGPQGEFADQLQSCYQTCIQKMNEISLKSIAFPCISTGIYGYANENAVHVALKTVRNWLDILASKNQLDSIDRVIFCVFLNIDFNLYESWMQVYFPLSDLTIMDDTDTSDEASSSPVEKTATDDGAKKTGRTKSSRDDIVSDSESENDFSAGSASMKCTDLDCKGVTIKVYSSDRSADVDVIDVDGDYAPPQLITTLRSSLPTISRGPDDSDSDLWETECQSSLKDRRCSSTADSQLEVSPKRMKLHREDNVSGNTCDEKYDNASRAKMSL